MTEEWRDIKGYEGLYQVSNLGRVKSLARVMNESHKDTPYTRRYPGIVLSDANDGNGYRLCRLGKNGKMKSFRIHRLVAQAFLPNPDNLPQVNHKDRNRGNNRAENLEWCTAQYNSTYDGAVNRMAKRLCKAVCQIDSNGNVVAIFSSVKEATRITGTNNISKVARGLAKTAKGYRWKYINKESCVV